MRTALAILVSIWILACLSMALSNYARNLKLDRGNYGLLLELTRP